MGYLVGMTAVAWLLTAGCVVSVVSGGGLLRRLRRVTLTVLSLATSVLLTALVVTLHAWSAFSGETLVATVMTQPLGQETFVLSYAPAGRPASLVHAQLQGDQWSISGGIVKWHPWLTALGLPSYHHPMRIEGRFSHPEAQRSHRPTVVSLSASSMDRWWEWCYRLAPYVSIIEAAYGSSAYVTVEQGMVQQVYITPTGYLIKRHRVVRAQPPSRGSRRAMEPGAS